MPADKLAARGGGRKRAGPERPPDAWTIGHSTISLEELRAVLAAYGIRQVADVRRYPASVRQPQFNREALADYLAARGVAYRWFEDLGGRRRARPHEASPNTGIASPGFRAYADYMQSPEFGRAFDELVGWMREAPTAILCAERLWWRCHRRLLSDLLVARGGTVRHIHDAETAEEHALWDLAVVTPEGVVYPPEQGELGLGR